MKKRVLIILLAIFAVLSSAFALSACEKDELADISIPDISVSDDAAQDERIKLVYEGYVLFSNENGVLPLNYEEWLESVKGADGVTPTVEINEDGFWVINGQTTLFKAVGKKGENGKDGQDGKSAYEIYKEHHPEYTGSESDWINVVEDYERRISELEKDLSELKDRIDGIFSKYNVEYYVQNLNDDKYSLKETVEFEDITGSTAIAYVKEYEHFNHIIIAESIESGNIAGDNSLVLKVYYNRDSFSFGVENESEKGGVIDCTADGIYKYGTEIELSATANAGYEFIGWYNGSTLISESLYYKFDLSKNCFLTAKWIAKGNTKFITEYYLENLQDGGYTLYNETEREGKTGDAVTADIISFEHFNHVIIAESIESGNIAGDNSLVLKVYYNRNKYSVALLKTVSSCIIEGEGIYANAQTVIVSAQASGDYCFIGWYENEVLISDQAVYSFNPVNNITLTAIFKKKLLAPKDFDYDGTYITWADANGAATYEIVVNEGEPVTIKSSTFKFKATEDRFTVSVTAKAAEGSEEYIDSDTVTKIFDKIAAVENIEFAEDATMTWDAVSGATGYVVEYNNGTKTKVTDCVFNELPAGTYSVKVKAVRDAEPSYVYYTLNAATVSNITVLESVVSDRITFDGTTIKWNAISGAFNYKVWIDDSDKGLISTNSMIFDAEGQSFNVKVLALGDPSKKVYNASEIGSRNFIYLAPVTNLSMDDGVLTWDAVKDAEGYEIKIRGKGTKKVYEPRFDEFTPGESTSLQIRAFTSDNTYFAGWTEESTYLLLKAPVLQWDDKPLDGSYDQPIYWDQVSNAKGYEYTIKGPEGYNITDTLGADAASCGSDFLAVGTYTITVKALADVNNNACDSKWSDPITVVRLASPKLDAGAPITSDPNDLTKGFTVTFVQVPEATNYRLYKNDISSQESGSANTTQITDYMNETSTGGDTASFVLQSIGRSYSPRDKKVVLDSLYTESESFQITVLATPSIDVEPITGMTYNFGKVSGTSKYTIKLDGEYDPIDDGDDGYDLSSLSGGQNYEISVNARGNGGSTLSSKYTAVTEISRLAAPTHIRINTSNGSAGNLYFDSILNAQSYEYTIDGVKYVLEQNKTDNIADKIGTDTKLFMRSIGNYYKNKIYYMDSPNSETYSFTKLPTPVVSPNNALKGTKLIWSKISNYVNYSPLYCIVNSKDIVVADKIEDGSFDLDPFLAGGVTETYYIYAIGNGTKYINSDTPVQGITITRLLKPEVTLDLEEKAYSWDFVPQAKEYQVYVDGILKETLTDSPNQDKYYYRPGFTQSKTYNVQITAIGNNGDGFMDSPKFEKLQLTKVLSRPTFTYSYDKNIVSNDGNIIVNITTPIEGALGYAFVVRGTTTKQTLYYYGKTSPDFSAEEMVNYVYPAKSAGTYSIDVYALGGNFIYDSNTGEYVWTLDSLNYGNRYSITLLGYPSDVQTDSYKTLKWNYVPNAYGYNVKVVVDGTEYSASVTAPQISLTQLLGDDYVQGAELSITIQATGKGQYVIDSEWSTPTYRRAP